MVICIHADTNESEQTLKRDFISIIKKKIKSGEMGEIFNVHVIKNHLAIKFNDFKNISKLHKKIKGHIYIFGETKKRKHGNEQYFLSLDGLVLHKPVVQQVSQELSKDFIATLPKGINFQDSFAFAGFQISANIVLRSVEYVSGIAAFISGNPFLATRLHTDLKTKLMSSQQKLPGDNVILSKIDSLLSDEYAIIATYYFGKNDQKNTYKNLELSLKLNLNCYHALNIQSIIAFSWENDPKKSLSIIKRCHHFNDPTWRYNEAFLHFWLGNYVSAWKQCEKIKNQNYPNELFVSHEVTQFNEKLLNSSTEKSVLYFWLGFNYYFKQHNLNFALTNLETFMQKADNTMLTLKQKASGWLIDIKKEGNWK